MKTIKQLDGFRPDQQLTRFFGQIKLGKILFLTLFLCWNAILLIRKIYETIDTQDSSNRNNQFSQIYGIVSFLTALSCSDFWLFLIGSVSDLKRQEEDKGTLGLIIGIIVQSNLVVFAHYLIRAYLFEDYPIVSSYVEATSIPLQQLLMMSISQCIRSPECQTYVFIKPFIIKPLFKPIFYLLLIEAFSLRVDVFVAVLMPFLFHLCKIDRILSLLTKKIENRLNCLFKLSKYRLGIENRKEIQFHEIDYVKTNVSVAMEEK